MKIRCIPRPAWAREPRREVELPAEIYAAIHAARERLLAAVEASVSAYLSNPDLVFDSGDSFPSEDGLTGDYYLSDELYFIAADGFPVVSVMTHFLGRSVAAHREPDDYLGLEVWLEWHADRESFSEYRNTDSSVI